MSILLHFGLPGAGCGVIGRTIRRAEPWFLSAGIALPAYARERTGGDLLVRAIRRGDNAVIAGCLADIRAAAREVPGGVVLVHGSQIARLGPRQLSLLAAALKLTDLPVRVISYLRPQEVLCNAAYIRAAEKLEVLPWHAAWGEGGWAGAAFMAVLDYDRCFRRLARLFDRGALMLRHYDRRRFPDGDIVADVAVSALPGVDTRSLPPEDPGHAALGWKAVAFGVEQAAVLHADGPPHPAQSALHRRALTVTLNAMAERGDSAWLGRSSRMLTDAECDAIRAVYRETNTALIKRFGLAPDMLAPVPSQPAEPRDLASLDIDERAMAAALFRETLHAAARNVRLAAAS